MFAIKSIGSRGPVHAYSELTLKMVRCGRLACMQLPRPLPERNRFISAGFRASLFGIIRRSTRVEEDSTEMGRTWLLLSCLLAGCGQGPSAVSLLSAPPDPGPRPENYRALIRAAMPGVYLDSATVRTSFITRPYASSLSGWDVCLFADARDADGVYTGVSPTNFLIRSGRVVAVNGHQRVLGVSRGGHGSIDDAVVAAHRDLCVQYQLIAGVEPF